MFISVILQFFIDTYAVEHQSSQTLHEILWGLVWTALSYIYKRQIILLFEYWTSQNLTWAFVRFGGQLPKTQILLFEYWTSQKLTAVCDWWSLDWRLWYMYMLLTVQNELTFFSYYHKKWICNFCSLYVCILYWPYYWPYKIDLHFFFNSVAPRRTSVRSLIFYPTVARYGNSVSGTYARGKKLCGK